MTSLWFYKYLKDEDLCQITLKPFDTLPKGEYPSEFTVNYKSMKLDLIKSAEEFLFFIVMKKNLMEMN